MIIVAASAHARAAIYTSLIRNFRVGLFVWMDGVYANEDKPNSNNNRPYSIVLCRRTKSHRSSTARKCQQKQEGNHFNLIEK